MESTREAKAEGKAPQEADRLARALDDVASSAPIGRLLAASGPLRVAHATSSGQGLAAAALSKALEAPGLLVAPDPQAAESLAAAAATFLGAERAVVFHKQRHSPYVFSSSHDAQQL